MLQWLNNNKHPEFWKSYTSNFKDKSNRYVVLSIESSGLNTSKDVILAFSAVSVIADKISIKEALELYISYSKSEIDIDPNDFLVVNKLEKKTEREAIELIINYIGNALSIPGKC